jgi:hypothetical protein
MFQRNIQDQQEIGGATDIREAMAVRPQPAKRDERACADAQENIFRLGKKQENAGSQSSK